MRNVLTACLLLVLALSLAFGCGEAGYDTMEATSEAEYYGYAEDTMDKAQTTAGIVPASELSQDASSGSAALPVELPDAQAERKIIYNAEIDLVVDDFAGVPDRVAALARAHGGFVAQSAVHGSAGEPRDGRWTLRIPSAHYDDVMQDAETIGQLRSVQSSSREVTAEFVDLQSRLRNKVAEEARLIEHLDQTTGDLKDILEVERELSRVRGEAEVLQGRLNMLRDLTSMSTVVVRVEEIRDYTPAPTEEPGFGAQAGRAWSGSLSALGDLGRGIAIGAVALAPWLVVLIPLALVGWFLLKRIARRLLGRTAPASTTL